MRNHQYRLLLWSCLLCCAVVGCRPAGPQASALPLKLTQEEIQEGQRVVRLHCATCHAIDGKTRETMLSPSLWGVREHYIRKYPEPEAFISAMMAFLDHPKVESSLMPLASKEYGLMAMLPLDEAQLRAAVRLIYAGHVDRPTWARDYDRVHQSCYDVMSVCLGIPPSAQPVKSIRVD